jgi:ABC-type cobalamin/Fe3+-siderophores transport system ATPase subunit
LQLFQKPVSEVTGFMMRWRMTRENIRRVEEFLERPPAFEPSGQEPAPPPDRVAVDFDQVSVRVPSGATVLSGVELQIPQGAHVALAGPAGCGKSTAIHLITRESAPSDGRVALNARAVADYPGESLARTVGFVPQTPILLNTSIRNNLLLGLRRASGRTLEDAEGPIDVSRLDAVQTPADLDRELLRVIRLVDLEADVLRKGLDGRLPAPAGPSPFPGRVAELRQAVADRLRESAADALIPFDAGRYLPGPLASNLVWVGLGGEEPPAAVAGRVLESLEGEPVVDQLLEFGRAQLMADHELRVRSVQRAPDLQEFLPSRPSAAEGAAALADRKHVPPAALPRGLRLVLLEVALDGDSLAARKMFPKEDFAGRVVAARGLIEAKNPGWPGCWRAVGPAEYVPRLTLRENLLRGRVDTHLLGAAERVDGAIQQVLTAAGLLDAALLLGLEYVVGEGGKCLSGGQRQKVALARALLKNPSLLLLDEATAALDERSQARVTEMVRQTFAGRTVVAISHRLSTIRHCDQIVVLDHGQVAQRGTYEELTTREGIFRDLVRREQGGPPAAGTRQGPPVPAAAGTPGVSELRRRLARCALFAHLKSDHLAFVERVAKEARCARGEVLFREGDPGSQFFLILDGEVEFFIERGTGESRRREVVNTYGPGGSFGELALFAGGRRTLGAAARTDLHLCVLEREDLMRLIEADPQIAVALLQVIATREAARTLPVDQGKQGV